MDEKILYFVDKFCEETIIKGSTGFIDPEIYVYKSKNGLHRVYHNDHYPTSLNYFARYFDSHCTHILITIPGIKFHITSTQIQLMTTSTVIYVLIEDESDYFNHSLNEDTILSFSTLKRLQKKVKLFKNEYSLKIYGDEL